MPYIGAIINFHHDPPKICLSYAGYEQSFLTRSDGTYRFDPETTEVERDVRAWLSLFESTIEKEFNLGLGVGQGLLLAFNRKYTAYHFMQNERFREIWKSPKTRITYAIIPKEKRLVPQSVEAREASEPPKYEIVDDSFCVLEHPDHPSIYLCRDSSLYSLYPR